MSAKTIARLGMLSAVALVLGYVESLLPLTPGIPGIKLGLANTVLLYSVYMMAWPQSLLLMLAKVGLSGLLFAGFGGMLYSLAGSAASILMMLLVKRVPGVSVVGVSITGAVAHNAGQLAVAACIVGGRAAAGYAPILIVSGVVTGFLTGVVARLVLRAIGGNACGKS